MLRVLIIFLATTSIGFGNNPDSVRSLLKTTSDKAQRVILYNAMADSYWHSSTNNAILYSDSAYRLSLSINKYDKGRVEAFANKGISAYTLGDYKNAVIYYKNALNLGDSINYNTARIFQYYLKTLKRQGHDSKILVLVDSLVQEEFISQKQKIEFLLVKSEAYIDLGYFVKSREVLDRLEIEGLSSKIHPLILTQRAAVERYSGNYEKAIRYINEALKINEKAGDSLNFAFSNKELGKIYIDFGRYDSALLALNKSMKIYKNAGYSFGIAQNLSLIGTLYRFMGQSDLAADNYYKALKIFEQQSNKKEMSEIYFYLARLFADRDMKMAHQFIYQSIQISKEVGNINNEATAYNYLASFYEKQMKYDSAIFYYDRSIELRKELKYEKGIAICEFNKGLIYEKMGQYNKALELCLKTNPIYLKYGDILSAAVSEYEIGGLYTKIKKFKEAFKFLQSAKIRLEAIEAKGDLVECLLYISRYYEAINDEKKALMFYKEYIDLKDKIYNGEMNIRLAELEVRYVLEKKEQELALISLENENRRQNLELQKSTINNQQTLIAFISAGILFMIILLIVTYRLLRIRNQSNKELENLNRQISENTEEITAQSEELQEANEQILSLNEGLENKISIRTKELKEAHKELDTFFYHASHDFRRPLTTFLGLADIAHTILKDPSALELFDKVRETAGSLDRMVGKLRAISTIDFDKLTIVEVNFETLFQKILNRHSIIAMKKNIAPIMNVKAKTFSISEDITEIILDNIIENAILYSQNEIDSWVKIETSLKENKLLIVISDNGQGIEKELTSRIFDMYFRANELSQGNGLGLYIVRKALNKLNGTITFNTQYGKGSEFIISIPSVSEK